MASLAVFTSAKKSAGSFESMRIDRTLHKVD